MYIKGLWGILSIVGVILILGGVYSIFNSQTDAAVASGLVTAIFGALWLISASSVYVKSVRESKR